MASGSPGPDVSGTRDADDDLHRLYRAESRREHRDALVERYASLALSIAARVRRRDEDPDDLRQVAMLGLVKAVERFDPDRGVAFTTFAWATISGELKRYRRDVGWGVHVPRRAQERYLDVQAALDNLSSELGRSPSLRELATAVGCEPEDVVEALELGSARSPQSFDRTDATGRRILPEPAGEPVGFERIELAATLHAALARLPDHQRAVLHLRFVEDLTQAEIGARLGYSQMHVSRLLGQALRTLRTLVPDGSGPA